MTMSRSARRTTVVAAIGGFAAVAALAGVGGAAWACTASPAIASITPDVVAPGAPVTVAGANYAAGPVEIRWNGVAGPVLAKAQGPSFSLAVNVPAEAAGGMFYIAVVQRDPAGSITSRIADTLEVSAPAASGPAAPGVSSATATGDLWAAFAPGSGLSPSGGADAMPAAGSSDSRNLAVGLGLLGVGTVGLFAGFAVAAVRRRRVNATR